MCPRGTKDEAKDEDDDDEAETGTGVNADDDEPAGEGLDAEDGGTLAADSNMLTDFQHKFEAALRQPSRGLLVKDLMVLFDNSTVYGRRAGFHKALMITVPCPSKKSNESLGLFGRFIPVAT